MIKNLFSAVLIVLGFSVNAQVGMSNLSFENWSSGPFGPQPNGWFGTTISQQTTGAQLGTSYVRIVTTNTSSSSYDGILALCQLTASFTVIVGEPYTLSPLSLNGFYKTSGLAGGDTVGVEGILFNAGNPVAFSPFMTTGNVSTWTSFSEPFNYFSSLTPDTIYIFAASNNMGFGGGPNAIGSTLDLDNLSLTLPTGVADPKSIGTAFLVYPNPASGSLYILSKDERAEKVIITNMLGAEITEVMISGERTSIDLENYASGIYCYSISGKDGSVLLQSKFVVTK